MNFVVYQRVSTRKQDYGLDAQAIEVSNFLKTVPHAQVLATLSEKESGADNNRPKLKEALALCKATGATLLCSKLDRLSRNASFLLQLQESGVDFKITSMPFADKFSVSILACVAQKEREMISERTKAGLQVAKARGVVLGNPRLAEARENAKKAVIAKKETFAREALKAIRDVQSAGVLSYNRIAEYLNKRGEKTASGRGKWTAKGVSRVLEIALYLAPDGSTSSAQ